MKKILFRLIGVGIFFYLLFGVVGAEAFVQTLGAMNPWVLLLLVPFHFLQWSLRIVRWRILLENEAISLSFWENYAVATAGFFLGCLTPGRVGEFSKVKFLMNAGFPFRGAFMSSFLERLLDVAALCAYVAAGIGICYSLLSADSLYVLLGTLLCVIGVVLVVVFRRRVQRIVLKVIPETLAGGVEEKANLLFSSVHKITPGQWGALLLHSLAIWGLNYWMIYLLFTGVGYSISFAYAVAFAAFGSLAGLLPFSPYGMGIREAVLIPLFAQLGRFEDARKAALIFGVMYLVLLVYHILLGFVFWMSPLMTPFLEKKKAP